MDKTAFYHNLSPVKLKSSIVYKKIHDLNNLFLIKKK